MENKKNDVLLIIAVVIGLVVVSGILGFMIGRHFPAKEKTVPGNIVVPSVNAENVYIEEVLPNETLQEIADRHGIPIDEIRKINTGLPKDGKLKPFTSIKIPAKF